MSLAALHRALDLVGLEQRAAVVHRDLELAGSGLVDVVGELPDDLGVKCWPGSRRHVHLSGRGRSAQHQRGGAGGDGVGMTFLPQGSRTRSSGQTRRELMDDKTPKDAGFSKRPQAWFEDCLPWSPATPNTHGANCSASFAPTPLIFVGDCASFALFLDGSPPTMASPLNNAPFCASPSASPRRSARA